MSIFFVTGTDTDAGKTLVSSALLWRARQMGLTTLGIKPIASGCEQQDGGWRNRDALSLQQQSWPQLDYALHNPLRFPEAIAPHIAAELHGQHLSVMSVEQALQPALAQKAQFTLIEGAGGWHLPLNNQGQMLSDWVAQHTWPVVLVIGLRLGCLNHASLTVSAIRQAGLTLGGWVVNHVDPDMPYQQENIATLQAIMPAPCLGRIPWLEQASAENAAPFLNLQSLHLVDVG